MPCARVSLHARRPGLAPVLQFLELVSKQRDPMRHPGGIGVVGQVPRTGAATRGLNAEREKCGFTEPRDNQLVTTRRADVASS